MESQREFDRRKTVKELAILKRTIPTMDEKHKNAMKEQMLAQIKKECVVCHKKGMDIDRILKPSYENKDFMLVLGQMGIGFPELRTIVTGYIEEYEKNKTEKEIEHEYSLGTTTKEKIEMTRKGARLAMLKSAPFFVKKEKIWEEFNNFINSLHQETFDHNVVSLIRTLNFGKDSCSKFKNTKEQTDNTIVRWPRLGQYQEALYEWIKQCRKEQGFEI